MECVFRELFKRYNIPKLHHIANICKEAGRSDTPGLTWSSGVIAIEDMSGRIRINRFDSIEKELLLFESKIRLRFGADKFPLDISF